MDSQSLLKIITADAQSHISFLQSFTQAPSPNPPGNTLQAASVITSFLKSHSITPEVIAPCPQSPNIVHDTQCSGPGPRLILNGHIDVFPVGNAKDWARPPWSGAIINNRLHGRGTVDMKAGTAASVIAYTYLHRYREHLHGSIALCAVSDEETGGKWGTKYLLEDERWRGDCVINAEPGGTGTIRFAEKGTLRLTFEVRTEGAHGAYLHRSASATRIAAQLITSLSAIEDIKPALPPDLVSYMRRADVRAAIDSAMGAGAADITLKPTLNIGTIHGGLKVNMIPSHCVFEADIRMPIGLERDQVLTIIHKILDGYPNATVQVQEAASNPAAGCAHDHPMVDILARNAQRVMGGGGREKPVAIPSMGATDCKFYRYKGIPAYVFGVSPEGMAARDESVDVQEFLDVLRTHALAAWEYLGGK